ncbi:MAG: ABC transporter permease [Clostridia bacterium]|nr:ABC transporter permease [Clostridia bacterium]NCC77402.1 ABC transporter permease [Clostridia bacterium]
MAIRRAPEQDEDERETVQMNTMQTGLHSEAFQKFKSFSTRNIIVYVLIALSIGFALGNNAFLQAANMVNLTTQMAINAMLSAGLTYVIILGGIDISVGAVGALSGVITALVARQLPPETPIMTVVAVQLSMGLVVGLIFGSFIGVIVAKFKVVPMIATLASLNIARGLSYIFSGGTSVSGLKSNYSWLGAGRLFKTEGKPTGWLPIITIVVVLFVILMHVLLSKTIFGRHVYATGSNINVAHLSGINTAKVIFFGHVICAVMAALGGVLNSSKLQNGQPGAMEGYEMYAIAATVLGGTSLSGGSGSVGRAMIGVAVIAVINNGMNLLHINSYWQKAVIGAIILMAVILDMAQKKKKV